MKCLEFPKNWKSELCKFTGNCAHYMYEWSEFAEKSNIQNGVNL